jgi:hypothetical protein
MRVCVQRSVRHRFVAARLRDWFAHLVWRKLLRAFAREHCACTRRANVEWSLSTRNPRKIRIRKAQDCLETSVKESK